MIPRDRTPTTQERYVVIDLHKAIAPTRHFAIWDSAASGFLQIYGKEAWSSVAAIREDLYSAYGPHGPLFYESTYAQRERILALVRRLGFPRGRGA